jgi:hypothetical protein
MGRELRHDEADYANNVLLHLSEEFKLAGARISFRDQALEVRAVCVLRIPAWS